MKVRLAKDLKKKFQIEYKNNAFLWISFVKFFIFFFIVIFSKTLDQIEEKIPRCIGQSKFKHLWI